MLRLLLWVVLLIAALEVGLRLTLDAKRLYSRFHTVPALNEWRNQVAFWVKNRDVEDPDQLATAAGYDQALGWDAEITGDRIRGSHVYANPTAPDVTRVVTLGDSYAFGFELDNTDTFSAILTAQDNQIEALNMGVPGYGIDQAYLKYKHHGSAYQPHVVLLAIYITDYERTSLNFSFLAKPKYAQRDGEIVLENVPVPHPAVALQSTEQAMQGRFYLVELVKNAVRKLAFSEAAEQAYFDSTDQIVTHILGLLRADLMEDQKLLVLHIPNADTLLEPQGYRAELDRRLINIYSALNLDYINLTEDFLDSLSPAQAYGRYYLTRDNGSAGHLSRAGHKKIAELVAARIR